MTPCERSGEPSNYEYSFLGVETVVNSGRHGDLPSRTEVENISTVDIWCVFYCVARKYPSGGYVFGVNGHARSLLNANSFFGTFTTTFSSNLILSIQGRHLWGSTLLIQVSITLSLFTQTPCFKPFSLSLLVSGRSGKILHSIVAGADYHYFCDREHQLICTVWEYNKLPPPRPGISSMIDPERHFSDVHALSSEYSYISKMAMCSNFFGVGFRIFWYKRSANGLCST